MAEVSRASLAWFPAAGDRRPPPPPFSCPASPPPRSTLPGFFQPGTPPLPAVDCATHIRQPRAAKRPFRPPTFPPSWPSAARKMYPSTRQTASLPALLHPISIRCAPRELRTAPGSCFPSRPPKPWTLRPAAISVPLAKPPRSPSRTAGSPSPPESPSSDRLLAPRAAHHKAHRRSSASHSRISRGQIHWQPPPTSSSLPATPPPRVQPHSLPKTPRYT